MHIFPALALALALGAGAGLGLAPGAARAEPGFQAWLEGTVWPRAREAGIRRGLFERALGKVEPDWSLPGVRPPGAPPPEAHAQAEFRSPARYFREDRLAGAARLGRQMAQRHAAALARAEAETGVPGPIVLAIWARESGFGRVPIRHDAFRVLATRAYASDDDYTLSELIGALEVARAGPAAPEEMRSSWAGALGQPQMMPRSFLAHGRDGDGDGRADIWGSAADSIASIAGFLADHGWQAGRDWGFEVTVPEGVSCALEGPDQARPISDWARMGVARVSGRPFPAHERAAEGALLMPAGRLGPAFIVTPNFEVLKRYNRSDTYALYVGQLADRIGFGMGAFRAPWAPMDKMSRDDTRAIQRALEALGHDVGGVDGLAGYKTRRAIGRWQEAEGRAASCFPSQPVLQALAR